jgi:hypothetical protein
MSEPTSTHEWPAHFPADCPPAAAVAPEGAVYRLVRNDSPAPDDMRSWLELGMGKGRDCQRAALSCAVTQQHLEEVRRASPLRRNDRIARAMLASEHGKLAQTGGPGHCSLWLRRAFHADAHRLFEVVS